MSAPTENALTDIRAEWVLETTPGTAPSNPAWNRFADYFTEAPSWSGDASVEGQNVVGSGDLAEHFRGPEEHTLGLSYWLQRGLVDGSGNAVDPLAIPMVHDYQTGYDSHTVVLRRETTSGGSKDAGFREYIVAFGARPTSATLPGDPSESQPIAADLGYEAEMVRQYVVHQPATSITPKVASTSAEDTTQTVTVESEGASTTDTFSLNGTTKVSGAGTASFPDLDAVWIDAETEGDIQVYDGNGNPMLEEPIAGSNTDGVEGHLGIPLLGTGSHASAIGNAPEDYLFLGTSSTFSGGNISDGDRLHALDLTCEVDVSREPQQGTRRQAIDIGPRTVSAEVDAAGPYESAVQNARYFRSAEGDLVYSLTGTDVTVKNSQLADTDDVARSAGDANLLYGVTFEGHGDPAITVTQA